VVVVVVLALSFDAADQKGREGLFTFRAERVPLVSMLKVSGRSDD